MICLHWFYKQHLLICIQWTDLEGLKKQSREGANMGFTGKQVIHPNQIPIVQEAFAPSLEQVEWATELIKAFEQHQTSGRVSSEVVWCLCVDLDWLVPAKRQLE